MTKLHLIAAQLRYRPLHTILVIASLALTTMVFLATSLILARVRAVTTSVPRSHLMVQAFDGRRPLSLNTTERVKRLPGVTDVSYARVFRFKPPDGSVALQFLFAATDDFPLSFPRSRLSIPEEVYQAWQHDRQGVVVDKRVADARHWKVGSAVTFRLTTGDTITGNLVGYLQSDTDHTIAHYDHVMRNRRESAEVTLISATCVPERCLPLINEIDAAFETDTNPTYTMTLAAFFEAVAREASTMPQFFMLMGVVIVAVSLVMTGCTLAINLGERSAELATLRAIGFTHGGVFRLVVAESMLAGLCGGVLGAGIPYLVTLFHPISLGGSMWTASLLRGLQVSPQLAAIGILLTTALGGLVCALPALRSSRKSVIEGLAS